MGPTPNRTDAVIPTANEALAAISGQHTGDAISVAADAMHKIQMSRYIAFGITMDPLNPIAKVQAAASQLRDDTDALAQLVRTIDQHVPKLPANAEHTIGESIARLAFLMVEDWAERRYSRPGSKRAALDHACDEYDRFRMELLTDMRTRHT